jgi:hypothetical protein
MQQRHELWAQSYVKVRSDQAEGREVIDDVLTQHGRFFHLGVGGLYCRACRVSLNLVSVDIHLPVPSIPSSAELIPSQYFGTS